MAWSQSISVILIEPEWEEMRVKIIVLNESKTSTPQINVERRCAVTPASVQRLCKKGVEVNIEAGSGELSHYLDNEYEDAGATIINDVNDALSSKRVIINGGIASRAGGQANLFS